MKVTARIVHGSVESTFHSEDDARSAAFFFAKAAEWASDRRGGAFQSLADNGEIVVNFADITEFSVEAAA